jgi:hypothetical protein
VAFNGRDKETREKEQRRRSRGEGAEEKEQRRRSRGEAAEEKEILEGAH